MCSGRIPTVISGAEAPSERLPQTAVHRQRRLLGGQDDAVALDAALEKVHRRAADEARDIGVLRLLVELGRAADLLDPAVAHHDDAVAHAQRLDLVVRDVEGRHAEPLLQLDDFGAHLHAQRRVEVGERLVHQEDARLAHDGAAERHALPLAAGQFLRPPLKDAFDAEHLRGLAHAVLDLRLRRLSQAHAEGDVREHVEMGEERVVLEDHRHVAVARQLVASRPCRRTAPLRRRRPRARR